MDDRTEEIFGKYDLKINNTYRARGALLLDTDRGIKLYGRCHGSERHLEYENRIKKHLKEQGYQNVDFYVANKEGRLSVENSQGEKYAVRDWFPWEECNLREKEEVGMAAGNLARLHSLLIGVEAGECEYQEKKLPEVFQKHNRELKRVRSYVLEKKQKNEFEVCFLKLFDEFYQQGKEVERLIPDLGYEILLEEALKSRKVFHGAYNHHNVLLAKDKLATTNFDKAGEGIQICDLYNFLRKTMEKNNWDTELGIALIESYLKVHSLDRKEQKLLYLLLLYPEKFWKTTNFYFNNKKSWISGRNIQKLESLKQQEKPKKLFLQKLEEYCIIR